MTTLINDLKYGLWMLVKKPGFTASALITLAIGIGANLALFGILNEMLLRPKPVDRPQELWAVVPANTAGQTVRENFCRPYYEAFRQERGVFKGIIGYANIMPKILTNEGAERIEAALTSWDYFSFLGVVPILGRGFLPDDETPARDRAVAVISHAFWKNRFDGMKDVLGKILTFDNVTVEVVGVAPRGFTGLNLQTPSLWMPASMDSVLKDGAVYQFVGRLTEPKLAVTAADQLTSIAIRIKKELEGHKDPRWSHYGTSPDFHRIRLEPIGRGILGSSRSGLKQKIVNFLTFAAITTMLLLLIACANVAGLFLARTLQRRREMAIRVALGATRRDLVRQVVCEGILLATGGTMVALLSFSWLGRSIMRCLRWWPGRPLCMVPDERILLFAVGGVLITGIGASLLSALQASAFDPFTALKDGVGGGRRRLWLRHGLIVVQVAGSLVLLCGATLCLRSMSKQLAVDLGYSHDRLAIASLDLERIGFTKDTFEPRLNEITRRVALIPGVKQVGVSFIQPLGGQMGLMDASAYHHEDYSTPDDNPIEVTYYRGMGPGTFEVMGIPMLRGREFRQNDLESDNNVVVINESYARKFWPNQDPVGKHIYKWQVVGVVSDACFNQYDEKPGPALFRVAQKEKLLHSTLLIRTVGEAQRVIPFVRAELGRIRPRLALAEVRPMRDIIKNALAFQRTAMWILGTLGILALVLALVGTYGVVTYVVSSRTQEIGIRFAVGATRGEVTIMILSMGLRLGLIAAVIGLPLALAGAIILRHQIAGISPFDPISFSVATAFILAALVAACWLPAWHAAKIDPMEALRYE